MTQTSSRRPALRRIDTNRPATTDAFGAPVIRSYEPTENDPFTHACCGGLMPAHTSRCRLA